MEQNTWRRIFICNKRRQLRDSLARVEGTEIESRVRSKHKSKNFTSRKGEKGSRPGRKYVTSSKESKTRRWNTSDVTSNSWCGDWWRRKQQRGPHTTRWRWWGRIVLLSPAGNVFELNTGRHVLCSLLTSRAFATGTKENRTRDRSVST